MISAFIAMAFTAFVFFGLIYLFEYRGETPKTTNPYEHTRWERFKEDVKEGWWILGTILMIILQVVFIIMKLVGWIKFNWIFVFLPLLVWPSIILIFIFSNIKGFKYNK